MSLDKNMSMNNLSQSAIGKKPGDLLNKNNIKNDKQNQPLTNLQNQNPQQAKITPGQSLVNTNSNISISQPVLTNPAVNQTALNATNIPQKTLNSEVKTSSNNNNQVQSTPVQGEFQGAKDLPAYAGIANMSLKSWVAQNNNQRNTDTTKAPLAGLFEAIKGFEKKNYEEEFGDEDPLQKLEDARKGKRKALILLSSIFGAEEHSGIEETELAVNIANFKKLGKKFKKQDSPEEKSFEFKMSPPTPAEAEKQISLSNVKIKHLFELFALPKEFPECIRLFAGDNVEINPTYFKSFILQRLKVTEEHLLKKENSLNKAIEVFVPFLNQSENQLLYPLFLLYYPLPFPVLRDDIDFVKEWKLKKEKKVQEVIASCEIYYVSALRGRFLIKIEFFDNSELTVDVQTAKENNGIVRDIELAIEEGMLLIESSPKLSELNVLLTGEIYKATDVDEELSIVSTGTLRIEVIIAVYSALSILNKLNEEVSSSGVIDMLD